MSIILLGVDEYHFKVLLVAHFSAVLRIRIRDPVPFLTPGSGIRNRFFPDPRSGSRIPNPYFHPSLLLLFWDPGRVKIRIRDPV
jgi:hypothetical protein